MTRRPAAPPALLRSFGAAAEVGRLLREARQARGEDLYDVADYLRIKPAYLLALEEGNFRALPGQVYAVGFLRTYGDYLGLDGTDLVERARRERALATAPEHAPPPPLARVRTSRGGIGLIAASIALVAVVYTGWFAFVRRDTTVLDAVAALPATAESLIAGWRDGPRVEVPAPAAVLAGSPASGDSTPPTALDATAAEVDDSAPSVRADLPAIPLIEPVTELAPELRAPAPMLADTAPGEASAGELLASLVEAPTGAALAAAPGSSIAVVATESSWVQVRSADRSYLKTRMLEPGERLDLPDRTDLALWTGNAGGIRIVVDGSSYGPIGESGKVVKNVPIDPAELAKLARN
jgi:cytoskeleton protein RodZ